MRAIPVDCNAATERLGAAVRFAESASVAGLHPEASFVLLYDAARNALSAVLAAAGKRVSDGRGAHALTIAEAGRVLGADQRAAIVAIDGARVARNRTEYDAQPVSRQQLEGLEAATQALLFAARAFLDAKCP